MIQKSAKYALILLVIPFLMAFNTGCNDEWGPEDKWPKITHWEHNENFDVTLKILKPFGIPQLKLPNRTVNMKIQVRSFHADQEYTVRVFLEQVDWMYTAYSNNAPAGTTSVGLPVTGIYWDDAVVGTVISGKPPQGTAELEFFFEPSYFPLAIDDWLSYTQDPVSGAMDIDWVTDRYIYHFICVIEDKDGRTDSFGFTVISELIVETDSQ